MDSASDSTALEHVLIGYRNEDGKSFLSSQRLAVRQSFQRVNAVPASVRAEDIELLLQNPDIAYIEPDSWVYPLGWSGSEIEPYGISMIHAEFAEQPTNPTQSQAYQSADGGGPCNDPTSFRIGFVDSGVDIRHPD